ncbi:hypothetical protein [Curtobacterium sp. Leaf261]|uniref:hypothetical protein n=1 Tax=Curtobacterium sp. Leaf261 TaxID=1736311 RepID=UPI0006F2D1D9|nr:hypothetical protein [Curtobacterium sp. Leaf261]KQO62212.1 hypothetical protein ASF23_10345 [Curtobacterium sp. Leaf261]
MSVGPGGPVAAPALPFSDDLAAVLSNPEYGIATEVRAYPTSDRSLIYGDLDWEVEVTHDGSVFTVHSFQRGSEEDPVAVCRDGEDVVRIILLLQAGSLLRGTGSPDPWAGAQQPPDTAPGVEMHRRDDGWIVQIAPDRSARFTDHRSETLAYEFAEVCTVPVPVLIAALTSPDAPAALASARD